MTAMNCFRQRCPARVIVHVSTLSWILFWSHIAVKASILQDGMPSKSSKSTQASSLIQRIRSGELITICRPTPVDESPEVKPQTETSSMSYDTVSTVSHYKKKHSDHHHHWIVLDQSTKVPIRLPNHEDSIKIFRSYPIQHSKGQGEVHKGHHHNQKSKAKSGKSAKHYEKGSKGKTGKSTWHHHKNDLKEPKGRHHGKKSKGKGDKSAKHHDKGKGSKEKSGKSTWHHYKQGSKNMGSKSTGHYSKRTSKKSAGKSVGHGHQIKHSKGLTKKRHGHYHIKHSKGHGGNSIGKLSKSYGSKKYPKTKSKKIKSSKGRPKGKGAKSKSLKWILKGKGAKSKNLKWSPKGKGAKSKGSKGSQKGKGAKSKGYFWFHVKEDNSFNGDGSESIKKDALIEETLLSYTYGYSAVVGTHDAAKKISVTNKHVSVVTGSDKESPKSYAYGSAKGKMKEKESTNTVTNKKKTSGNKSSIYGSFSSYNYGYKSVAITRKFEKTSATAGPKGNDVTSIAKGSSLSYDYGSIKGQKTSKANDINEKTSSSKKSSLKGSSLSYNYDYKSSFSSHHYEKTSVTGVSTANDIIVIAKKSSLSYEYGQKTSKAIDSYEKKSSSIKSSTKGNSLSYNYGYKSSLSSHHYEKSSVSGVSTANKVFSIAKGSSLSYGYGNNKGQSNEKESKAADTISLDEFPSKGVSLSYKYGRRREKAAKKFVHLTDANDDDMLPSKTGSFMSAFGMGDEELHNSKRALSDEPSNGEYCTGDSLPIEIICQNSSPTTDFVLNMEYEVEVTSSLLSSSDLAKVEADMLSSASQAISCLQNCGCIIAGVSSSSSPMVQSDCKSYEGSYNCFEVKDTMSIHLVHLDGLPIEKDNVSDAVSKVTSYVKADAKAGTYNHGSIIKVKVLSAFADDTYTFRNEVGSGPITIPQSSTGDFTSTKEAKSSTGFIVGLALLCAGVFAVFFFAALKKKAKNVDRDLDDLAQAYYDGDDHFSKLGPWDVLSLSTDGKTLTSSVIDPSLNPAETSKNVHICTSAMCTECSTRKNRSQRVQFIPCADDKRSETNHDYEDKSF